MGKDTDAAVILEADKCRSQSDIRGMLSWIQKGLIDNYENYELYFMLGEYYLDINPYQAYLCFENAELYCTDEEDLAIIRQAEEQLAEAGIAVSPLSIVILSYNAKEVMELCLDSLRKYGGAGKGGEIIIIDNASTDGVVDYLKEQEDIKLFCNAENAGFPAGCNQGIKMSAPNNDILLLNNDTVMTPNAIFWLRMGLYEDLSVGGAGSVANYAGNHQAIKENFTCVDDCMEYARTHNVPMERPYEKRLRLIGFAFMIKRTALDAVGLLDERFSPGNYEDNDLSYRLIQAGYQLLLCRNSFICHLGSVSFSKDMDKFKNLLEINADKFKEKWGFDAHYYSSERRELADYIAEEVSTPFKVLEIGCGMGAMLGYIQNCYPNAEVYGIELSDHVVQMAKNYLPSIEQGNIENMSLRYSEGFFDYIIFADVLEHLHNPGEVLADMRKYLKPSGFVLASIPNLLHHSVILDLLRGRFSYQDEGILDRTHLRFFTIYEISQMFKKCGYHMEDIRSVGASEAMNQEERDMLDALLKVPGVVPESVFGDYQYMIKARKADLD